MEGQQKGKKAPTGMRKPVIPMEGFPPQTSNRNSRNYEAESPQWPSTSAAPSSPPPSIPRPKPAELIDRYVAQGMDREAASERAIEDLQTALQRSLYPMQRLASLDKTFRSSATLFEAEAQRLARIESKLDAKPNIAQIFAAGFAAGAVLQTAIKATPPVVAALNDIVGNIRRAFQR